MKFSLSLSLCSLIATRALAQTPETRYSDRTILVKFREQADADRAREQGHPLLDATRSRVAWSSRRVAGLVLVETPPGLAAEAAALMALGEDVEYAQRDAEARPLQVGQGNPCLENPDDPTWVSQQSTAKHARIHASEGWKIRTSTDQVIIAIVDTGINYNLAEFNANMWKNPGENPTPNNIDDDNNGIVDDIYGADFANPLVPDGDPQADPDHGCTVASMAGAVGNNSLTMSGVAWSTRLMAMRMFGVTGSFESSAIMCIEYAIDHGANVINCSFSIAGPAKSLEQLMVNTDLAVLFVIAAGNNNGFDIDQIPGPNGEFFAPAMFWPVLNNALVVGGSDALDHVYTGPSGSNVGLQGVDLFAPGDGLTVIACNGQVAPAFGLGTSLAAPQVSAAAALVWAEHPSWSCAQVSQQITNTVDVIPALSGSCKTSGRLNLAQALGADCD